MSFRPYFGLGVIPRGLPVFGPTDTIPDPFSLADVAGAALATVYSATITLSGMDAAAVGTISGAGTYSINGGAFTNAPGLFHNGDIVVVHLTSSAVAGAPVSTTLTIGGVSDTFTVTTSGAGTLDFSDPANSALIV